MKLGDSAKRFGQKLKERDSDQGKVKSAARKASGDNSGGVAKERSGEGKVSGKKK